MRVLLDHCVPRPFGQLLGGHEVRTTREEGWDHLSNGELLARASSEFGAIITVDQSLSYQRIQQSIPLPVIVIVSVDTRIDALTPHAPAVLRLLSQRLEKRAYVVG